MISSHESDCGLDTALQSFGIYVETMLISWIVGILAVILNILLGGHSGRVVTLSSPTSEAGVWFPAQPQVGKPVVACHW